MGTLEENNRRLAAREARSVDGGGVFRQVKEGFTKGFKQSAQGFAEGLSESKKGARLPRGVSYSSRAAQSILRQAIPRPLTPEQRLRQAQQMLRNQEKLREARAIEQQLAQRQTPVSPDNSPFYRRDKNYRGPRFF